MKKLIIGELQALSRNLVRRFRPFVIGVTGSSGKTTTKYFITELLRSADSSVLGSSGNLNTEIGIPLAILGFRQAPEKWYGWLWITIAAPIKTLFTFKFEKFLVLEYGADKPNDIDELTSIVKPDIVVITNISTAHIESFGTEEKIAKEKWKLALSANEAVIVGRKTAEKIKDFGLEKVSVNLFVLPSMKYAKAENIETLTNKTVFDLYIANKKYETEFNYFGGHNIDNLELAVFSAHLALPEDQKIINAIKKLSPLPGRGKRFFTQGDILVIDESYNANPASMKAALENLSKINYGRKVSVLGQMAEIGHISKESHKEVAELAREISDFTVGLGEPFKDLGLDRWYKDVSELISESDSFLKAGDEVLVKGSRWANRLDKFIEYLEQK
jgi:UDP-N-acetylmuramoyl-tripeptide--D-alanyl-D-alanine ligase